MGVFYLLIMTQRKITTALKKIDLTFQNGNSIEALILNYHLNITLIKLICSNSELTGFNKDKKIKKILTELSKELCTNQKLKGIISKTNLKMVKVWLNKMDVFFKLLKHNYPSNSKVLFQETQKITGVLNISAHKITTHA